MKCGRGVGDRTSTAFPRAPPDIKVDEITCILVSRLSLSLSLPRIQLLPQWTDVLLRSHSARLFLFLCFPSRGTLLFPPKGNKTSAEERMVEEADRSGQNKTFIITHTLILVLVFQSLSQRKERNDSRYQRLRSFLTSRHTHTYTHTHTHTHT